MSYLTLTCNVRPTPPAKKIDTFYADVLEELNGWLPIDTWREFIRASGDSERSRLMALIARR